MIAARLQHRAIAHPLLDQALVDQMRAGVAKQQVVDPHSGQKKFVYPVELEAWLALAEWQRLLAEFPSDGLPLYP